jgi:hypothetical protein
MTGNILGGRERPALVMMVAALIHLELLTVAWRVGERSNFNL